MKFDKNKLEITPAPFADALELKRSIGEALNKKKLEISGLNVDLDKLVETEVTGDLLGSLLQPVLSLVNSREVERDLMLCAKRALYDKNKIDADFFEPVETRELYFPIMLEIAKVNIGPFFAGLFSGLKEAKKKAAGFLKSKSK